MITKRFFIFLVFHALDYIALVFGSISVTFTSDFNYDTNVQSDAVVASKSLCENIVIQSSTSISTVQVRIDSNLDNPFLGCLGIYNSPWKCVTNGTVVNYLDFCNGNNFKILPDASNLYSQVELNQAPSIQKTSFNVSFISSTATISRQLHVIFNLTDLSKWWPIMGNYGGNTSAKDCNSGHHIQLFTHVENFWDEQIIRNLNFQCSDGAQYYANPRWEKSGFGSDIAVNCTNEFGINGMKAYIGASGMPIGGIFYCGNSITPRPKTSEFGSNIGKERKYFCKPGSLVTGTRVYHGSLIEGFGLACSPINLNVALINVKLSSDGKFLSLTRDNFQITRKVGNINYLRLIIDFPSLPQTYKIKVGHVTDKNRIFYGDILAYGADILFETAPRGEFKMIVTFDTMQDYAVPATLTVTGLPEPISSELIATIIVLAISALLVLTWKMRLYRRGNRQGNSASRNINLGSIDMVPSLTDAEISDSPPPYTPLNK